MHYSSTKSSLHKRPPRFLHFKIVLFKKTDINMHKYQQCLPHYSIKQRKKIYKKEIKKKKKNSVTCFQLKFKRENTIHYPFKMPSAETCMKQSFC
ncbi:hypothetical protein XELAEV_18025374mg [Xenopus laevis]|uniref:Uncharacterized protein n=1 Tax=Xenopus laevis TaxID=8355 RepID=A0A974CZD1_XENLA|nr:hypothetical protein XELAEV_18025374mg [Xenopus laevis]